jgi:hypothetical protein
VKLVTVGRASLPVHVPATQNIGRGEPVRSATNAKANRVPTVGDAVLVWSARQGGFDVCTMCTLLPSDWVV